VFPQAPQFFGSVEVLTHAVGLVAGHRAYMHPQAPAAQYPSPVRQAFPHPPQFDALVAVSTQVPVAGSGGVGQSATVDGGGEALQTQPPELQVPRPQACPQLPQLPGSVARSTQADPQACWPAGQLQAPPVQDAPL